MAFHQDLLAGAESIWRPMLDSRFLRETAENTIPASTFARWLQQDYLFVRETIPFVGLVMVKLPPAYRQPFTESALALHKELALFEQMAQDHGVSLEDLEMSPTCHAYSQFLLATGYNEPFPVSVTALYAAEKAYLDSWSSVAAGLKDPSPWWEFIEHWSSPGFREWVNGSNRSSTGSRRA